jgi:hypothetical protein
VPPPGAVPSTKASPVETKVTEAALNPAGTGLPEGCAGDAELLGVLVATGLADVGALDGVAVVEDWPVDPHPAETMVSAKHSATRVRGRELRNDIVTSLSVPGMRDGPCCRVSLEYQRPAYSRSEWCSRGSRPRRSLRKATAWRPMPVMRSYGTST